MKRVKKILDALKSERDELVSRSDLIRAEGYERAIESMERLYKDVREKDKTDVNREAWREIRKVVRGFERIAKDIEERRDYRLKRSEITNTDAAFFVAYDTIAGEINKQILKVTNKYK